MHCFAFGLVVLSAVGGFSPSDDLPKAFDVVSVKPCFANDECDEYRRLPGGGLFDFEPLVAKGHRNDVGDVRFIVDDERSQLRVWGHLRIHATDDRQEV